MITWNETWKENKGKLNIFGDILFFFVRDTMQRFFIYPKNKRVLEVGCGAAYTMEVIKSIGYKIVGIDNSPESVEICKRKGFEAVLGDAKNIPFPSKSFDIVFSEGMLAHQENLEPVVKELTRVGKKVVFIVPNHQSFFYKILIKIKEHTRVKEYIRSLEDYNKAFSKFGYALKKSVASPLFRMLEYEIS
jgi:ubiquinone/menaquinone biosynthesis C-methylase UbiE